MRDFVIRRTLAAFVVLVLVSMFVFGMMHLLPGDALVVKLGETGRIPPSQMAELRAKMGIDDPLVVQYINWVRDILDGSMGDSLIFTGRSVSSRIGNALPVTIELGILGMASALIIGLPLGVISAVKQDSPLDYLIRVVSLFGLSIPQFWLGIIIIVYGTRYLGYAPPSKWIPFEDDPIGNLKMMWIPALVLGFGFAASIMRITRSTVLEALHEDYARTARAKGLAERAVVYRHVVRNALIPVVTFVGNQAAFVFSGALLVELLFLLPGMGRLTLQAIQNRDYPQVQGSALVAAAIVVFLNLLVDISYGWIDPRVRYS
ncbi:MAG: ABC transporter permease [Chloroflexi bacterium]|nr:ABC transporter permease [Chloroflexota bacterium]